MACLQRIATTLVAALAMLTGLAGCDDNDRPHIVYGFIDAQGHWAVAPTFPDVRPFSEGRAGATRGSQWGYIDTAGHWAVEPRYDDAQPFSEGLAAVKADGQWRFIGPTGVTLIGGPFAEAHAFQAGLAAVQVGKSWGFVDHAGAFVIPARFAAILDQADAAAQVACFSEGLCAAREGERWGYIDRSGSWAIAPRFDEAWPFREGVAAVSEHTEAGRGKVGFIDHSGSWAIAPRFEASLWFSGGRAIAVVIRPNGPTAVMIDAAGREIAEVGWQPLLTDFKPGASAESGQADTSLLALLPDYLAEGLAPASREGRWGFMDRDGKWRIDPTFTLVFPFHGGLAVVAQSDEPGLEGIAKSRWGLIDTHGRRIVEPALSALGLNASRLMLAQLHSRWGLLDSDGTWRVPPVYLNEPGGIFSSAAWYASGEGLQRMGVYANHRWVVVDRRGHKSVAGNFEWLEAVAGAGSTSPPRFAFLERGLWGLADGALKPVVPARFDGEPIPDGEFLQVSFEGRTGCIDAAGRWIVPPEFSEITSCNRHRAVAMRGKVRGTWEPGTGWHALPAGPAEQRLQAEPGSQSIDAGNGSTWQKEDSRYTLHHDGASVAGVLPVDEVTTRYMAAAKARDSGRLSVIRRGELWGVVDARGGERLPVRYEAIGAMRNGLFAVRAGGQWGIVESGGRELFRPRFEQVQPFNREVAVFCEAKLCGLVERAGTVLLAPRYSAIEPLSETLAKASMTDTAGKVQSLGIIDAAGRLRVELAYKDVNSFSDQAWSACDTQGKYHLLDKSSGRPIGGLAALAGAPDTLSEGLAATKFTGPDGKTVEGYVDARGRIAIAPRFDPEHAGSFSNGVAVIRLGGRCGAIDRRGRTILSAAYDHCLRLVDGGVLAGAEAPLSAAVLAPAAPADVRGGP